MRARDGFTLVEITIAFLLLSFFIAGLGGLVVRTQQQYNESLQATRVSEALRTAETAIATLLRSAGADPYGTGDALFDPDYLGNGRFDNFRARSDFNPADGSFGGLFEDVRVYADADTLFIQWSATMDPHPVAAPVHALTFEYFDADRNPVTDAAAVATSAVTVKVTLETTGHATAANHRSESWVFLRNNQ